MKFTMALRPILSLGYVLLSVFAEAQLPILGLMSHVQEERWSLEKQLENLEEQMSSLAAPRQRAQDRVGALNMAP